MLPTGAPSPFEKHKLTLSNSLVKSGKDPAPATTAPAKATTARVTSGIKATSSHFSTTGEPLTTTSAQVATSGAFTTSPPDANLHPSGSGKSSSPGKSVIIGVAAGGAALLLIAVLATVLLIKRKRDTRFRKEHRKEAKSSIMEMFSWNSTTKPSDTDEWF